MRYLLFIVLPIVILGTAAYHYRNSWLPHLTDIAHTPSREVAITVVPSYSPLPQITPTTIPELNPAAITVPTVLPGPVSDIANTTPLPNTGPADGPLILGGLLITIASTWYVGAARIALRNAIYNTEVL